MVLTSNSHISGGRIMIILAWLWSSRIRWDAPDRSTIPRSRRSETWDPVVLTTKTLEPIGWRAGWKFSRNPIWGSQCAQKISENEETYLLVDFTRAQGKHRAFHQKLKMFVGKLWNSGAPSCMAWSVIALHMVDVWGYYRAAGSVDVICISSTSVIYTYLYRTYVWLNYMNLPGPKRKWFFGLPPKNTMTLDWYPEFSNLPKALAPMKWVWQSHVFEMCTCIYIYIIYTILHYIIYNI